MPSATMNSAFRSAEFRFFVTSHCRLAPPVPIEADSPPEDNLPPLNLNDPDPNQMVLRPSNQMGLPQAAAMSSSSLGSEGSSIRSLEVARVRGRTVLADMNLPSNWRSRDAAKDDTLSTPCPHCQTPFSRKSNLNRHIRQVHLRQRPHQCKLCDMSFGQKSTLKTHLRFVHEKAKPFACDQCSSKFGQVGDLNRHCLTVHQKGKYGSRSPSRRLVKPIGDDVSSDIESRDAVAPSPGRR